MQKIKGKEKILKEAIEEKHLNFIEIRVGITQDFLSKYMQVRRD